MGVLFSLFFIFSHPDFTVGIGVSPIHAKQTIVCIGSRTITAGMEFHQTPKCYNIFTASIILLFPFFRNTKTIFRSSRRNIRSSYPLLERSQRPHLGIFLGLEPLVSFGLPNKFFRPYLDVHTHF